MAENKTLNLILRVLQLICAIIVLGTDGYAVHVYHGYTSIAHTPTGDFSVYTGVPNAWGFLIFCATWTILVVVLQVLTRNSADRAWIAYTRFAVEMVAVLSWFAGWIAVAVNIGTGACRERYVSCGALKAATVFGAVEWLLFVGTAILAVSRVLNDKRASISTI